MTPLPGGGATYHYDVGSEEVASTVPPSTFDAATASASALAEYGIPAQPPAGSPEVAAWQAMIHNVHFVAPPADLVITGFPHSSTNWGGIENNSGGGNFTHVTGYFWEPVVGSSCSSATLSTWAGLGVNTIAQDGTNSIWPGSANNQAWVEVFPNGPINMSLYATPGYEFEADVHYVGSNTYTFYMYNFYTGGATHWSIGGVGSFAGNTSEALIERVLPGPLATFTRPITMQLFTNGQQFSNYGSFITDTMVDNSNYTLAYPSIYNGYQFNMNYQACS